MAKKAKLQEESVVAIKAFDHELKCRGFQFAVGETYDAKGEVIVCLNGFHAVTMDNPFHAWDFYPPVDTEGRLTRYATVSQSGAMQEEKTDGGVKIASAKISIDAELSLPAFIKRGVEAIISSLKGDYSTQAASGYSSTFEITGQNGVIACSGNNGRVSAKTVAGTWVSLAEYDKDGKCIGFATGCIGTDGLAPGHVYIAKGGKLVKAEAE